MIIEKNLKELDYYQLSDFYQEIGKQIKELEKQIDDLKKIRNEVDNEIDKRIIAYRTGKNWR